MVCFFCGEQGKDQHVARDEQDEGQTKDDSEWFRGVKQADRDDNDATDEKQNQVQGEVVVGKFHVSVRHDETALLLFLLTKYENINSRQYIGSYREILST